MKNLIIVCTAFWCISFCSDQLIAQPTVPNTPTASMTSYSKYAEIEPNLYNGATSIPISITSLSEGPLSTSVSLSYHTAGIRAHELSSTIGLGWSLNAGGAVTRRVRGLADESEYGWLNTGNAAQSYGNGGTYDTDYRADVANGEKDGEADIFYFQVGGLSGQFVFDHNNVAHTVPESDILIVPLEIVADEVMSFKIVDTQGTQYFFGTASAQNPDDFQEQITSASITYTSTWFLRQIKTHDNLHSINFNYSEDHYSYFSLQDCSFFGTQTSCEMTKLKVDVRTLHIASITTTTSSVIFDYQEDRQDLLPFQTGITTFDIPDRLYQIRVTEAGRTVTHALSQSYFQDTEDPPSHLGLSSSEKTVVKKRLKLDAIDVSGGGESLPPYSFTYYGSSANTTNGSFFPSHLTQAIDHWGYYNGAHDNNDEDYIIPTTAATCGSSTNIQGEGGVSRAVNPNAVLAGNLSKIIYPLGGSTSFTYSNNEFWNPESQMETIGYQTHSNVNCGSNEMTSTSTVVFINEDAYYHGKAYVEINSQCGSGGAILTISGSSGVIETIAVSGNGQSYNIELFNIPGLQANKTYTFKLQVFRGVGTSYVEYSYNGTNEPCGGLRLAVINTTDNNGTSIQRNFNYSLHDNTNESSGVLYRFPKYGLFVGAGCNGFWAWSTNSIVGLQSFEGYHVGYSSAQVDYNGNGTKRINFYNDFAPPPEIFYPPVPENEREFVGQQKSTILKNESGDTLSFSEQVMISGYDNTIGSKMVRVAPAANGTVAKIYEIHTGKYLPSITTQSQEGITTTTDYYYSTSLQLQPIETATKDENGNTIESNTYQYTTIYTGENQVPAQNYFDSKNIKIPWKTSFWLNGVGFLATDTKTHFNLFSGVARPNKQEVITKVFNGILQSNRDTTLFSGYDGKGNLTAMRYSGDQVDKTYEYYTNSLLKKSCFGTLCSTYEYVSNNGSRLLQKKIAPDGTSTSYDYDGLRRLKQIKDDQTLAQTDITFHLSNTAKSYSKTKESYLIDPNNLSALTSRETRQYVDGLGRNIQTIGVGQASSGHDQLSAQRYDDQGRVQYQYDTREASSGNNGSYVTPQASWVRTETIYEPSPLNRVSQVIPPALQPVSYEYGTNDAGDLVIKDHAVSSNYASGTLFKRTVIDGNLNRSIKFTDVRGRDILSRRKDMTGALSNDTYYLYDDKNQLSQVIPPGSTLNDNLLNYYYQYDPEGKITGKRVPSKGWMYYHFNDRDLLLAHQDSFLRDRDQWYVYRYDDLNRERETGFYNSVSPPIGDLSSITDKLTETYYGTVSNNISLGKVIETRTKILDGSGWLKNKYNYDAAGRLNFTQSDNHLALQANINLADSTIYFYDGASNVVKTRNRITDQNNDYTIIENYQAIDNDGRTFAEWIKLNGIEQQLCAIEFTQKDQVATKYIAGGSVNHLQKIDYSYLDNGLLSSVNGGIQSGTDLYGYQVNYDTQPTITPTSAISPTIYDNGNISSIQWTTLGEPTQLTHYRYDYLNRLTNSYTQDDLYNTIYTYDPRGNFTSVERYADIGGVATIIDDLVPDYNANNANQMIRMNESALSDKGYKSSGLGDYEYDGNGNLISDPEKGISLSYNYLDLVDTITWDDGRQLIFNYTADGSLLQQHTIDSVNLKTQDYLGMMEYLDGYPYTVHHAEGRIVNKGLEKYLKYIYLDHQQTESGLFAAEQVESVGQIMDSTTYYEASQVIVLDLGFEVSADAEFVAQIVTPPTYTEQWIYEYDVRDHLGNLRLTYSDLNNSGDIDSKAEILQRIDYYPYGMRRNHYERSTLKNNYQYNGIEHVNDFGLDLSMASYRSLDAALGTWGQVDPKAESLYGMTPYGSMNQNPISIVDPDGDLGFLAAVGIGAAIGAITGGAQNGWDGAWKGALLGGASGAASFGLGGLTSAMSTTGANLSAMGVSNSLGALSTLTNIAGHSAIGGFNSFAGGGDFGSGALSGGFGAVSGMTLGGLGSGGQLAAGALSGGVGSLIGGGNFWQGAGQGLISSGLNHVAHQAYEIDNWDMNGDGKLSLREARRWYRRGNGKAIDIDFSRVDLSGVTEASFGGKESAYINLLFNGSRDGLVYGTIRIENLGNFEAQSGFDRYDFDIQSGRSARNILTRMGAALHGSGTGFRINFQGTAYYGVRSPYYNQANNPSFPMYAN